MILRKEPQASSRASERTAEPSVSDATRRRLERELEAKARGLRERLMKLPRAEVDDYATKRRRAKLGAQLTSVVRKLNRLRQPRLL